MHISVPVDNTMEFISKTEISPLITKGVCKVCYVSQQANRNGTVITKEVATEMGRKLPGSPVVGYYNEDTKDFEGHEREIIVKDGNFKIVDITKPYGFVPTNATVWFQKFNDDGVEHEYLVTEVYIWTKAYPESKRIFEKGNNHSMELDDESQQGFWTKDNNSNGRIFIYNEALIEKLCILGQEIEPCFEGAQITSNFSLNDNPEFKDFKNTLFSMMNELQEALGKGGSQEPMENDKNLNPQGEFVSEEEKKKKEEEAKKKEQESSSNGGSGEGSGSNPPAKKEGQSSNNQEEEDKKKKQYNLEEVTEYTELLSKYSDLQASYSALEKDKNALESEVVGLREFKLTTDRANKEAMIESFYMLTDEDKKDVKEHIDTYSLDQIEAKLSILCVRNKVNFNLDSDKDNQQTQQQPQGLFNLEQAAREDAAPDWIQAIRKTVNGQ